MASDDLDESQGIEQTELGQGGYDASNPSQVGQREKKAKERKARISAGFNQMLANPNTRAWLWNFLSELRPFETVFTAPDALVMAHRAGQKDVALKLLAELTTPTNIQKYLTMMEENNVA